MTNRRSILLVSLVALALGLAGPAAPASDFEIKMATLSPEGSPWDNIFKRMGKEWQEGSQGRVSLVVYPGGMVGDESDILRKMRFNQYHGAMISVSGLSDIDEYFNVFQIPLFFDSYDELGYVLDEVTGVFEERLADKGFVFLGWGYVGWVHVFTTKPVNTVDDLRALKLFTWAGDDKNVQWWKKNGFQPVPLAATDILTGLQTGMIEALPTPPLAAMHFQYYRRTPYMMDLGLAPMIGAMIVTERAWKKIDPADQSTMLEAAERAEEQLTTNIAQLDEAAIKLMGTQGLKVVEVKDGEHAAEWLKEAEVFAKRSRDDERVPAEIFDQAIKARDAFRKRKAAEEASAAAKESAAKKGESR